MKSGNKSKTTKKDGKPLEHNEIELDVVDDEDQSDEEPQQLKMEINDESESDYYDEEDEGGPESPPNVRKQ